MELNIKNNLNYYTFLNIQQYNLTKHCFSTKLGGVSTGVYESMNLAFRKDSRENVIKNYEIICSAIGVDYKNSVFASQTHEDKVYIVTLEDAGKGLIIESDIYGYDALITNQANIPLITFYADCVPVFMLDPIKKVIASAHSGWKGTLLEISAKTVKSMQENFNCNPKDIIIGIGPSIGKCCFQVGSEVVEKFNKDLDFAEKFMFKDVDKNNKVIQDKYKIDLQGIIKTSLINAGVLEKNIELSGICTMCNRDKFYSHRAMGAERGSMAGIISLCE